MVYIRCTIYMKHMTSAQTTYTADELGAMANRLGFLSKDLSKLRPEKLAKATGLGNVELSRLTKVSRPSLYKKEVELTPKTKKLIWDLVMATDLAWELLGSDPKETERWMVSPNSIFMGYSPLEICLRGEGSKLIEWLNVRLGKVDGIIF